MTEPASNVGQVRPHNEVDRVSESSVSLQLRPSSDGDVEKQLNEDGREALAAEDATKDEDDSDLADEENVPSADKPTGGLTAVLSRVISRASSNSSPGPPPDGGRKAWITGRISCLSD